MAGRTSERVEPNPMMVPEIQGPWWPIAGDPDLGEFTDVNQQPVDFAVWQAADGTWQLWSCIRHTKCGGMSRLFYRWEGRDITDSDWQPMGIAMQAEPAYGETPGGLQAPHVIGHDGNPETCLSYLMLYGDWVHICAAVSADGKNFQRRVLPGGVTGMFSEGENASARDPMLLRIGGLWHCYYTAHPNGQGAVFCRTSTDTVHWSESKIVACGGSAGSGPCSAECPFVVEIVGDYYLFRTQRYGEDAQTSVYRSNDPMDFGVNDDRYLVCALPIAAPEVVEHDGQWYLACLMPSLKGIHVARLVWETHG